MCCCIKNLCDELSKDCFTRREKAENIYEYIKKLPTKLFRIKQLDIADICLIARDGESLTTKEKALLIRECLDFINEI